MIYIYSLRNHYTLFHAHNLKNNDFKKIYNNMFPVPNICINILQLIDDNSCMNVAIAHKIFIQNTQTFHNTLQHFKCL